MAYFRFRYKAIEEEIGRYIGKRRQPEIEKQEDPSIWESDWHILLILVVLLLVSIVGWRFYHGIMSVPEWLPRWNRVRADGWNQFVGIVMMGTLVVNLLIFILVWAYDWTVGLKREVFVHSVFIGILESLIYPVSYLVEPRFVVVWLGLKTVSTWPWWSEGGQRGRVRFNRYLFGTGLSLLLNGATYGWLKTYVWLPPFYR